VVPVVGPHQNMDGRVGALEQGVKQEGPEEPGAPGQEHLARTRCVRGATDGPGELEAEPGVAPHRLLHRLGVFPLEGCEGLEKPRPGEGRGAVDAFQEREELGDRDPLEPAEVHGVGQVGRASGLQERLEFVGELRGAKRVDPCLGEGEVLGTLEAVPAEEIAQDRSGRRGKVRLTSVRGPAARESGARLRARGFAYDLA
jgi:hypothetical protein